MSWSCHIAGCMNSIRHIENRFLLFCYILFYFLFLMQFRLWRAPAFVSSPIHLFKSFKFRTFCEIWGQVVSRVLVLCALYTCQAVSVEDVCGQMTNVIKPTSCSSAPSHTRRVGVTLALYSSYCHYSLGLFYWYPPTCAACWLQGAP